MTGFDSVSGDNRHWPELYGWIFNVWQFVPDAEPPWWLWPSELDGLQEPLVPYDSWVLRLPAEPRIFAILTDAEYRLWRSGEHPRSDIAKGAPS